MVKSDEASEVSGADNQQTAPSLVSQILSAAMSTTESTESNTQHSDESEEKESEKENPENDLDTEKPLPATVQAVKEDSTVVDSPGTQSRRKLGFTGNSAFAPVKTSKKLSMPSADIVQIASEEMTSENVQNKPVSESVTIVTEEPKVETKTEKLADQMSNISDMFNEILRVAHLLEKALRSSLSDVTCEK